MHSLTARWLRIKRLERPQLIELHRLEDELEKKWNEREKAHADGGKPRNKNLPHWTVASERYLSELELNMGPFWDKRKEITEREAEIQIFEKKVYPVWKPIFDKEPNELVALHKSDLEIWANIDFVNNGPTSSFSKFKQSDKKSYLDD